MEDRSKTIFGNEISRAKYEAAVRSKENYIRRFGDDSDADYKLYTEKNACLGDGLGVRNVRIGDASEGAGFDTEKGVIVGNIRMGFGHYRISIAMASAAHHLGYQPYWLDLNSFPQTTCTKVISAQNDLYSMGSRISQKSKAFNAAVWEPMNYEGFKALTYNAADQKNAELMTPIYRNIPKEIPVIATHVWPAQAAIHAGMRRVINAMPDNWAMALHLAEGAVHTIQCRNAYMGYRTLSGMAGKKVLKPMPYEDLVYTGHYVDHELVANIEADCERRKQRARGNGEPVRFLLTIGGAGAQKELFAAMIRHLLPQIAEKKAALYVNVGDYRSVWDELAAEIPQIGRYAKTHFDDFQETSTFAEDAIDGRVIGIHAFYHKDIFEAVYCTNLLMRSADVLVTKPSELSFYPIPKLFIRRVGKHEMWGAIHSAEIGDGTPELRDEAHINQMLDLFLADEHLICDMCDAILLNKQIGIYDGAYRVVELAMEKKA